MRYRGRYGDGFGPAEALLRHPATQAAGGYADTGSWLAGLASPRPVGPDDDDDFLAELHRRIHGPLDDA